MEYLMKIIEEEHGKSFWKKPQSEQLYFIAEYSKNIIGAIEAIKKLKNII